MVCNPLADAVSLLNLSDFVRHGFGILGVAREDLRAHGAAIFIAEQGNDHLLVAALAVAVVAESHDLALGIFPFKITAGDVVENQVAVSEMLFGQGPLNGRLALQEAVHDLVAMFIDIDFAFDSAQFPERGVLALVGKGQLAARIDNPADNHRQSGSDPGFIARIKHFGQLQFPGQLVEGKAGDATVIGVLDLAVEAEGGADEAVMIFTVSLDFQMEVVRSWHSKSLIDGHT